MRSIGNTVLLGTVLLVIVDMVMLRIRLRRQLAERFPDEPDQGPDLLRDHPGAADEVHAAAQGPGQDRPAAPRRLPPLADGVARPRPGRRPAVRGRLRRRGRRAGARRTPATTTTPDRLAGSSPARVRDVPDDARRRGVPRRVRAARGGHLAAPALPRPGPGRDVAAGAALASHRVEDALHRSGWLAVGLVTPGSCCCRWARASRARVVTTTTFAAAPVARRGRAGARLARRPPPRRPAPRPAGRAGVRRLGDLGARRRHAGGDRGRGRGAGRAVVQPRGVLALLARHARRRRAVDDRVADRGPDVRAGRVGVAFLGDGVRDGWWPAVVVGLVLSTVGAVLLACGTPPTSEVPLSSARR